VTTLTPRQVILLVTLFVATSFTFIALDNRHALDPVRNGVHGLLVPVTQIFKSNDATPSDPTSLQAKYEDLQKKYAALQADNAQLKLVADEVNQLRAFLNLQQQDPNLKYVPASVLYYSDPSEVGGKFVVIDKGSADGVEEGMAITDPNYYVGLVTKVEEHQSRVALAIDDSQSVGAQLLKSGDVGIAWGMWNKGGRIELRHVDRAANIDKSDMIVTASKSEARTAKVPGGLIIGTVGGDPVVDNQGDTETIPIIPAANFDHLTVVAVIISDGSSG
jgi:rod shape-determining protein MreC